MADRRRNFCLVCGGQIASMSMRVCSECKGIMLWLSGLHLDARYVCYGDVRPQEQREEAIKTYCERASREMPLFNGSDS
jgi:hypothetical protein